MVDYWYKENSKYEVRLIVHKSISKELFILQILNSTRRRAGKQVL